MIAQDFLDSILSGALGLLDSLFLFLFVVFYFTIWLYLTVSILKFSEKTTLNEQNRKFFKRSFNTVFSLALILLVMILLIGFLALALFISFLGGGSNPLAAMVAASGAAEIAGILFATETSTLIFLAVLGLLLLITSFYAVKSWFRVSWGWGILAFIIAVALGIGIEYLLGRFLNFHLFTKFMEWGQFLETMILGWVYPPSS
jgi:hypothetical protein